MAVIAMRERLARRRRTAPPLEERLPRLSPGHAPEPAIIGNALSPEVLTGTLRQRDQGYLQRWVDLADEAREKSPHLQSQLAIRELSVVETEFAIVPGEGHDVRGSKLAAKRAVAACQELLTSWQRRASADRGRASPGWRQWVAEMVAGSYYGRSVHEVLWERVDGLVRPVALDLIDPRRLSYAADPWDPERGLLRLWDEDDPAAPRYGVPLVRFLPDKTLINEVRVRGAQRCREGTFATIVWWWLFSVWAWRDAMAALEMYGRPPVIGYYAAGGARGGKEHEFNAAVRAQREEIQAAEAAVHAVTGALRAMLPDTTRLEALRLESPSGKVPAVEVVQVLDRLISKAVTGVDSISDLKPGARAAVEVQERTSYTFWKSDCVMVEELVCWLFERFVRANPDRFGADCPVPRLKAATDPPKDRVAALEAVAAAQKVGMKVPRAWAHQESGIPEPQADAKGQPEPVLEAPTPAPTAAPGAPDKGRDAPAQDPPAMKDARE